MRKFLPKVLVPSRLRIVRAQGARCNAYIVRYMHIVCPFPIKTTQFDTCLQIINFPDNSCRGDHHFALLLALLSFDMVHSLSMFSTHFQRSLFGCSNGVGHWIHYKGESPESAPISLALSFIIGS